MLISSDQRSNMLRAGAYFPPSRNGRFWSPSAAAPGHQERLALVMGIVPYTFFYTPSALRARPPDMGTVMDTTSPKLGDNYERCYNSSPGRGGVRRTEG